VARKVFLAMLEEAGFLDARYVGAGSYRTSGHTQATFYVARKPGHPQAFSQ
jgi:hypothetical protein